MSFCLVNSFTLYLIVFEHTFISAIVSIGHKSFTVFLTIKELSFICNTAIDYFLSCSMRFSFFPLATILKKYIICIKVHFSKFSSPLKFSIGNLSLIKSSIFKYVCSFLIVRFVRNYFSIVKILIT